MDELKLRIDQLNQTDGAACPLCGQPLSSNDRNNLIEELETLGKSMGDKWRANRTLLAETGNHVTKLQSQISDLKSLDQDLLQQHSELNRLTAQLEQIEAHSETWQQEGLRRLESIIRQLEHEDFSREARSELAEIDTELKEIGYDAVVHDQVRRMATDLTPEDKLRFLERAQAAIEPLENELDNLQSSIEKMQSENTENA